MRLQRERTRSRLAQSRKVQKEADTARAVEVEQARIVAYLVKKSETCLSMRNRDGAKQLTVAAMEIVLGDHWKDGA